MNVVQRRGQVSLSTESRINLKDGVIKLINPGRTYYFRSPSNKHSQAEKSYTVGQWFEGKLLFFVHVVRGQVTNEGAA